MQDALAMGVGQGVADIEERPQQAMKLDDPTLGLPGPW